MLIFGLAAILGYAAGRLTRAETPPQQRQLAAPTPTPTPPVQRVSGRSALRSEPEESYIEELEDRLAEGTPIPRQLIRLAMEEAYDAGDQKTARAISILFSKPNAEKSKSKDAPKESRQNEMESPIEHIPSDAWKEFVSKLRVREPSYQTDRHVGCFEHNRQRLKALGVAEPKTEEDQYKALVTDLTDHYEQARPLIDEFSGDAVSLNGTEHPITMSGILALLKSGGVQGAEEWLRDPTVRDKFPRTKELFLKANGCF